MIRFMSRMVIFLGIIIFAAIAGVILFNKNSTVQTTPLLTNSPTPTQPPSPLQPSVTSSVSAALTPTPETSPSGSSSAVSKAIIKTTRGDIQLQLFPVAAPNTVANFVKKAQSNFYNNLTFHRVENWVIQGGDPLGNGTGGGTMTTELNDKPFVTGSLGVARGGDISQSNDSQFFITKSDASWLNKQYTNFGIVTNGMDVVNKIQIGDKILGITVE